MASSNNNDKRVSASASTPKNKSTNPKPNNDSTTKVYSSQKRRKGIWGNPRVVFSFRCDKELKKQSILFLDRVFGSICLPLEALLAGLLGVVVEAENHGVYPSSTTPLKLDVGRIIIERNLRSRRRLEFAEDQTAEAEVIVEHGSETSCAVCGRRPVVRGFYSDSVKVWLCGQHFRESRSRLVRWRELG